MAKIIMSANKARLEKHLSTSKGGFKYTCMGGGANHSNIERLLDKKGISRIGEDNRDASFKDNFCTEYIDLIGKLSARYNSPYWWATFVSSKNRFASTLMNNLYSLYSAADKVKRCTDENILIVSPDRALSRALKERLGNSDTEFLEDENWLYRLTRGATLHLKTLLSAALFIFRTCKRVYISRTHLGRALGVRIKDRPYYVIKTFIYNSTFDEKSNYSDAFFGVLPEYLRDREELLILADVLGDYRRNISSIKKNKTFTIVPLEYILSYWDPIKAVLKTLINRVVVRGDVRFFDFNISGLINSEIATDYKRGSPFAQYLHLICTERLLKIIKIKTFVLTYENNPWEKMCIAALRRESPHTKIIGYQHTVVPQASANMFISEHEEGILPLPDKILTVGSIPKGIMERYGLYRNSRIEESCALRFDYLFNTPTRPRSKSGDILVVLEGIPRVYRLVNYVLKELLDRKDLKIKIRTHPVLPFRAFGKDVDYDINALNNVSLSNGRSVRSDVDEASIVVYWGSTVALEALMMGKPVIHFDMQNILSYDPLFENHHLKWTVTEDDSLIHTIDKIYGMDDATFCLQQAQAREYLDKYFYKVTEEGLQKFAT